MNQDKRDCIERLNHLADELAGYDMLSQKGLLGLLMKLADSYNSYGKYIDDEYEAANESIWVNKIESVLIQIVNQSKNSGVRTQALEMLADYSISDHFVSDHTESVLIDALSDLDKSIRSVAAWQSQWLVFSKPQLADKVSRILLDLLADRDKEVRRHASSSLGSIAEDHIEARRLILGFLRGPIPESHESLWNAIMAADEAYYLDADNTPKPDYELKQYADALLSVLMRLKDNKAWACWKAGESLGFHVKGEIGFDALVQALKSPYVCGRISAIHGFSHLENPDALPYLQTIAEHDRSVKVRGCACEVIEYLSKL